MAWHLGYLRQNRTDVMFGCASLDGTDPKQLAMPLSFLHHYARAPEAWRARALPERYVEMNRISKEAIDPKEALRALPPLIKGYLRLGAYIGDGAVIDHEFGTTDVLIVLPVSAIESAISSTSPSAAGRRKHPAHSARSLSVTLRWPPKAALEGRRPGPLILRGSLRSHLRMTD